jgi:hypothetical protein
MQTQTTQYPFTVEQLSVLNREQREAIDAVVEYLSDFPLSDDPTDEEISQSLNLLKFCESSIPPEEFDGDILESIRRKFSAVFCVGLELADQELTMQGFSQFEHFSFCPVIEPCFDDASHVVIVDYELPVCYLHEWHKAWCFHFNNLEELADAVLNVKKHLVAQVKLRNPKTGSSPTVQDVAAMLRDFADVVEAHLVHGEGDLPHWIAEARLMVARATGDVAELEHQQNALKSRTRG